MSKNLKDYITEILDKSGLVDIHLAQGLIVKPIIDHIENNLPKQKKTEHEEDGQGCGCYAHDEETPCETKDNEFNGCLRQVKEGLGLNE